MTKFQDEHPFGTSLLSRDTPQNREKWGSSGIGYVDINPNICSDRCPHYTESTNPTDDRSTPIHLMIASFRDRLCPRTLHNAFTRSANPSRIFIRIIDQRLPESDLVDDASCWERYCKDYNQNCEEYRSQVYTVDVDSRLSKGPTDARSKLSALIAWDYQNEPKLHPVQLTDFCMQTDSHMDFSDHFDVELIAMHHRTRNDYAVLSTYVSDISENNKNLRNPVPNLCMVTFTGTIRNWGTKECRGLAKPKLTNAMWGAGLSFHRCHAEIVVPTDPYLDDVFDGEEGSRGIRLFTHGYDVYTPDVVLVTHDYHTHQSNPIVHTWGGNRRKAAPTPRSYDWLDEITNERVNVSSKGTYRVNLMLGIGPKGTGKFDEKEAAWIRASRFGLGTRRTLAQAINFTGIDLWNREMVENRCGNLQWVPYEALDNFGVTAVMQRRLDGAEDFPERTSSFQRIRYGSKSSLPWWSVFVLAIWAASISSVFLRRRTKRDVHKD